MIDMQNIDLIIFDLWGTVVESEAMSFHKKIMRTLGIQDEKTVTDALYDSIFVKKYRSNRLALTDLCNKANIEPKKENIDILHSLWKKDHIKIQPRFNDLLGYLHKRYKIGLLSVTDHFSADLVFKKYKIKRFFDYISLSCDTGCLKPDKNAFFSVLDKMKVIPENAVMIGDSLKDDIYGAKKIGMRTIYLGSGKTNPDQTADFMIKDICRIPNILRKIELT